MQKRYWSLFWLSLAMVAHAVLVGRYLPSSFFVVAFPWGWVALSAIKGDLLGARSMMASMFGVMLLTCVFLLVYPLRGPGAAAQYGLALFPSLVSWGCGLAYIYYLEAQANAPADEFWVDWSVDDAEAASANAPADPAALVAEWARSAKLPDVTEPVPGSRDLSTDEVAAAVASLRPPAVDQQAA